MRKLSTEQAVSLILKTKKIHLKMGVSAKKVSDWRHKFRYGKMSNAKMEKIIRLANGIIVQQKAWSIDLRGLKRRM